MRTAERTSPAKLVTDVVILCFFHANTWEQIAWYTVLFEFFIEILYSNLFKETEVQSFFQQHDKTRSESTDM